MSAPTSEAVAWVRPVGTMENPTKCAKLAKRYNEELALAINETLAL